MNRFVCGVFTWQETSSTNINLVPRMRSFAFSTGEHGELLEMHKAEMCYPEMTFVITLDLGNESSPRIVDFFGHLPEVYCNDRFELSSQLDKAREKLLSAVIRMLVTESVVGGVE